MPAEERRQEDEALLAAFLAAPETERAQTIFLFYGVGTEPDTSRLLDPLLRRGKRLALPRMLPGRRMQARLYCPDRPLVPHRFGIPEPDEACPILAPEEIDLVLVPALCYDRRGIRLGMGGGYYDRWLADFSGPTLGLCREALLQDRLPAEPHDRPVDAVLTPAARFGAN